MQRDRIWSDVYVDHELDSVNGEDDLPLELPLVPLFCGFCPWLQGAKSDADTRFAWKGKYNPKYKCLNLNQNESGVGQMSMSAVCQLQLKAPDLLFEPTSKWSAGPRLKRRRDITRVQNVLPDEASVEPDLT